MNLLDMCMCSCNWFAAQLISFEFSDVIHVSGDSVVWKPWCTHSSAQGYHFSIDEDEEKNVCQLSICNLFIPNSQHAS